MKIENRIFPYPVFGINQPQLFTSKLIVEFTKDQAKFQVSHKIECEEFLKKIKKKEFIVVVHIYCSATYFRESFVCKDLIEVITIDSSMLNDVVELSFFICANKDIINFTSKSYVSPFEDYQFSFNKGDILAFSGTSRIVAKKSPEELKSVSSFMQIETTGKKNHPMQLEYDDEKLLIRLSIEDFKSYQLFYSNELLSLGLHSSIVLPALAEAIRFITDDENSEGLESKRWYVILDKLIRQNKSSNPLSTAQKILELPIKRTLTKQIEWLN